MQTRQSIKLLSLLIVLLSIPTTVYADNSPVVVLNGQSLPSVKAINYDGTLYVPLRGVFEHLGADISWQQNSMTATIHLADRTIAMQIGNPEITVTTLDQSTTHYHTTPAMLNGGATMIPLRVVAECLGGTVNWSQETKTVSITLKADSIITPQQETSQFKLDDKTFHMLESKQDIQLKFGTPNRIDTVAVNFSWYVYNADYAQFIMLGFEEDALSAVFSTSPYFSYNNIPIGAPAADFERFANETKGYTHYIFKDNFSDSKTAGLLIKKQQTHHVPESFSKSYLAIYEQQVIDVTNGLRVQYGLKPLLPDTIMAASASAHSVDMGTRQFFDHLTPEGKTPYERMAEAGLDHFSIAAENIASGFMFGPEVCFAWLNSASHRSNLLNSSLTYIGVGTHLGAEGSIYCTQNMYTP